jgi:hypothetical protein
MRTPGTTLFLFVAVLPAVLGLANGSAFAGETDSPVSVSAYPLFGNRPVPGKWAAFAVAGRNDSPLGTRLDISVAVFNGQSEVCEVRDELALPAHSSKVRFVYFPAGNPESYCAIQISGDALPEPFVRTFKPLFNSNEHWSQVAVLGTPKRFRFSGVFVPFYVTHDPPFSSTETVRLDAATAPDHYLGYDQFFAVLIAPEMVRSLGRRQLDALLWYVRRGGYLVVIGQGDKPVNWNHWFLKEVLPAAPTGEKKSNTLWMILKQHDIFMPDNVSIDYTAATAVRGAPLIECGGDETLVQFAPLGLGTVAFMGIRLDDSPMLDESAAALWGKVLALRLPNNNLETDREWIKDLLKPESVSKYAAPGMLGALGIVLLFLIIIGPLDFILVRATGKKWLTWLILPSAVILFTGIGVWASAGIRSQPFYMNSLHVVRYVENGGYACGESYHCVMFPGREELKISQGEIGAVEPVYPLGGSILSCRDGKIVLERNTEYMEPFFFKTTWVMPYNESLISADSSCIFYSPGKGGGPGNWGTSIKRIVNRTDNPLSGVIACAELSFELEHLGAGDSFTTARGPGVSFFSAEQLVQNNTLYFDKKEYQDARRIALAGSGYKNRGYSYSIDIKSSVTERYKSGGAFVLAFTDWEPLQPLMEPPCMRTGGKSRTILMLEIPAEVEAFPEPRDQ